MNLIKNFIENDCNFEDYDDLRKNFKIRRPDNFNFAFDVVDVYAEKAPDKRAIVWCDDKGGEKILNFKELSVESKKAANFLVSLGVKKGDKVLMILRRRWEFWITILALHRIGAVAIPATNQLLQKDIEYRIDAADVKTIIVCEDPVVKEIENARVNKPSLERLILVKSEAESANVSSDWIDFHAGVSAASDDFGREKCQTKNDDIMLLYFTSGTSGYPKMVQHDFIYPLAHIVTAKIWQNVTDDGLHLSVAETGWAKAMWGKLYGQWICGSAVFVYDMVQFKPHLLMQKISDYKVTTFCAPPTVYRYLVRTDLSQFDLSSLKYCVTAGEALNPEVYNKFYSMTGLKMREGYGQTESVIAAGTFLGIEPKPGSMGKPAPGYDLQIVDENGNKAHPGETGYIVLKFHGERPIGLFAGYYKDDNLTKSVFSNGVYRTGDTAYYDEDGYIWFVGRSDDLIKSSGYRVSPFEVESIFQQHPSVLECAVTGIPDKKRGQAIKATVVLAKGFEATEELRLKLMTYVKERTANYKQPRVLEFVKELPKTISGKIRRVEIREQDNAE
ncbi:MAG: AMP-binding protein [Treponema sp.]|nr:AMP-binding protein [Treponema sp.]